MKSLQRVLYRIKVYFWPRASRTVRVAFPLVFTAAAFLSAAALLYEDTSYIRISTNDREVSAGDRFSINVYAGAHVPVNAIDISVGYPRNQIEVEGIDTGESVITIWTVEPYAKNGEVILRGGTFRKGFLGEHLIATINAKAKQSGIAKFTIDQSRFLAGDGHGTSVTIEDSGFESLTMYVDVDIPEGSDGEGGAGLIGGSLTVGIYTDINGDGNVDMNDILSFMSAWRNKNKTYDFNGDGRMTFVDFAIILADSFFK